MEQRIKKLINKVSKDQIIDILSKITSDNEIEIKNIPELVRDYQEKNEQEQEKIQCEAITSKGQRCYTNALKGGKYCKRHQYYDTITSKKQDKIQCKGIKVNGIRCCRDAIIGMDYCGHHKNRTTEVCKARVCLYGAIEDECIEEEDEYMWINQTKCKRRTQNGKWFCNKHDKYQELASYKYKYENLDEYIKHEEDSDFIMDDHIENYKNLI